MHLRSTFPSRLAMLMMAKESRQGQQQKKAPIHTFISTKLIICCLIAPRALRTLPCVLGKSGLHINLLKQPPPKQVCLSAIERLNAEKRHLGRSLWEPHTMMPFACWERIRLPSQSAVFVVISSPTLSLFQLQTLCPD